MTQEEKEKLRQPTEVFSRIVGYMRPITQWNDGKKSEWELRKVAHLNNKE